MVLHCVVVPSRWASPLLGYRLATAQVHHDTARSTPSLWPQTGSLAAPLDGKAYEMALARTRQAVSVHQAVQFQRQGNPARSVAYSHQMLFCILLGLLVKVRTLCAPHHCVR